MSAVHRWVQLSTALFVFWLVLSMPLDLSDLLGRTVLDFENCHLFNLLDFLISENIFV